MVFGFKKDKKENIETKASDTVVVKKGKKDGLASVLNPSVVEAVYDAGSECANIVTTYGGRKAVFMLHLKAEDIGGLSKKVNDADKGQIIQLMNGSSILVLTTDELLSKDELFIIPTEATLGSMEEFLILRDAPYTCGFLFEDGSFIKGDDPISFDEIYNALNDDKHIDDVIGVDETFDEDVATQEDVKEEVVESAVQADVLPVELKEEVKEEEINIDAGLTKIDEALEQENETFDVYNDAIGDVPEDEQEEVIEDDVVVEDELVQESLVHTLHSTDLGLSYSMDPFDMIYNSFKPMSLQCLEKRDAGEWLTKYVNTQVSNANDELRQLREHHYTTLRAKYSAVMHKGLTGLLKYVDYNTENGRYATLRKGFEENRDKARLDLNNAIDADEKVWKDEYEAARKEYGEAARKEAEVAYDAQHKAVLEARMERNRQDAVSAIEVQFNNSIHQLHISRRDDARLQLDSFESQAMDAVAEDFKKMLIVEKELALKWQNKINAYIDENRKTEQANIENKSKELALTTRVSELEKEYELRLSNLQQEYQAKKQLADERLDAMKTEYLDKLKFLKDSFVAADEKHKKEMASILVNHDAQVKGLSDAKKSEEARLRDEIAQWKRESDKQFHLHRRSNLMLLSISVIAILAAIFVGVLIGLYFGQDIKNIMTVNEKTISNVILPIQHWFLR